MYVQTVNTSSLGFSPPPDFSLLHWTHRCYHHSFSTASFLPSFAHFLFIFNTPSAVVLSHEPVHWVSFYSPYSFCLKRERKALKNDPIWWIWWIQGSPTGSYQNLLVSLLVSQHTTYTSLNCGFTCFSLQWYSASILDTNIVIYGNYPSLGSSIKWLLLGDGSSCCLVRGSSTVRGNAGEFNGWHL